MGYQYKGECLETLLQMQQRFAQDCSGMAYNAMTGTSQTVPLVSVCNATSGNVTVQMYDVKNNVTWGAATVISPPQYTCTYETPKVFSNADVVQLSWLVVGVWVVAWGIRKLTDTFKTQ